MHKALKTEYLKAAQDIPEEERLFDSDGGESASESTRSSDDETDNSSSDESSDSESSSESSDSETDDEDSDMDIESDPSIEKEKTNIVVKQEAEKDGKEKHKKTLDLNESSPVATTHDENVVTTATTTTTTTTATIAKTMTSASTTNVSSEVNNMNKADDSVTKSSNAAVTQIAAQKQPSNNTNIAKKSHFIPKQIIHDDESNDACTLIGRRIIFEFDFYGNTRTETHNTARVRPNSLFAGRTVGYSEQSQKHLILLSTNKLYWLNLNKYPCIICKRPRHKIYVLLPCGHTSLCESCCLWYSKCPSCRKPIKSWQEIFLHV